MNLSMWEHVATQKNVEILKQRGTIVLDPASGELACGEEGVGRMMEPERIVAEALQLLKKKSPPRLRVAGSS
jgi:phosphopantothenoylcysteine decarboxylase/phosphopantothenate--cysteine ligase